MGTAVKKHHAKLGIGAASPVTEPLAFLTEGIKRRTTLNPYQGLTGTRSRLGKGTTRGNTPVGGPLRLTPRPEDLAILFPRILGAAAVGTTYGLATTIPEFFLSVERKTKVFNYAGMKINRATFRSSQGQPLELELDVQGKTLALANAGTFPGLTYSVTQPFTHSQAAVSFAGVGSRIINNIELTIDNQLDLERYFNSETRTELSEGERLITLRCVVPFTTDEVDLYDQAVAGIAGSIVYTNGGYSLTFTFDKLQAPSEDPSFDGEGELLLPLEFTAVSDTTNELVVTLDSTP